MSATEPRRSAAPAAPERTPLRVLLYSHDSVGLGHSRRNLALAHAFAEHLPRLTRRPVTGLLLTGLDASVGQLPTGFDRLSLPGITKGATGYEPRSVVVPMTELTCVRSALLSAAVLSFRPDLMVVDRHAYGVDGELREALAALRISYPAAQVVLGLREVLDEPDAAATEWAALGDPQALRHTYDTIWVYGDPQVHDVRTTGEVPLALRDKVRHTGYLATGRTVGEAPHQARPTVLTMAGGGMDGLALCRAAAAAEVPTGHGHLVVTGPQMSEADHVSVVEAAREGTRVVRQVPDGLAAVRGAAAVVAMGGYNTIAEALTTDVPLLVVPRERPRREQAIRAHGLAARGALDVLGVDDLTPEAVAAWVAGAVGRRVRRDHLDLDGLRAVAHDAARLFTVPAEELSTVAG